MCPLLVIIRDKPSTGYFSSTSFSCSHNGLLASLYYPSKHIWAGALLGCYPKHPKQVNGDKNEQYLWNSSKQQNKISAITGVYENNNRGDTTILNFKPFPDQFPISSLSMEEESFSQLCPSPQAFLQIWNQIKNPHPPNPAIWACSWRGPLETRGTGWKGKCHQQWECTTQTQHLWQPRQENTKLRWRVWVLGETELGKITFRTSDILHHQLLIFCLWQSKYQCTSTDLPEKRDVHRQ